MKKNFRTISQISLIPVWAALFYVFAAHFFDLYILDLQTRLLELVFVFLLTVLVSWKTWDLWARLLDRMTLHPQTSLAALGLALITLALVFIKGFNQLPPYPPHHLLSFKWDTQKDPTPLVISEMAYASGETIDRLFFQVGGDYSFENEKIYLSGPVNRMVFENNTEMAIRIRLESTNGKNIEATWDGLPLTLRTENGNSLLKIPAYNWQAYGMVQKLFWGAGYGALTLVEFSLFFTLFFLLLVLAVHRDLSLKMEHKVLTGFLFLFLVIILQRAWICDDAYITFRTVDNFINGYGLTWNVAERVQAFTHPLWMLLLSLFYFFIRNIYWVGLLLSLGLSFGSVFLLVRKIALTPIGAALAVAVLSLSNGFVDYATSGLENPLSYFLLALFLWLFFSDQVKNKPFKLSLIASLAIMNRMDTVVFFIFPLIYEFIRSHLWKTAGWMLLGQLPFVAWEIFSLLYYGFLFPNTAYAKLNAGLPQSLYTQWALDYYRYTIQNDLITLAGIAGVIAVFFIKKDKRLVMAALGIPLYLLYILRIGGDFMGGRYFALPLLCSMVLISRLPIPRMRLAWAAGLLCVITMVSLQAPLITPVAENIFLVNQGNWDKTIGDERLFYSPGTGFTSLKNRIWELVEMDEMQRFEWPYFQFREQGERLALQEGQSDQAVYISDSIGFRGFYAGPQVTLIDVYALADPLLARLPVTDNGHLRVGHMERKVPDGYLESVESGQNRIVDPQTAGLYDRLLVVTRGDLFSPERWGIIWEMNREHFLP